MPGPARTDPTVVNVAGVELSKSVLVISPANTILFKRSTGIPGCQLVKRGWNEPRLREAVMAMARPTDLVVLDGHGSLSQARFASGEKFGIPFDPPEIVAPQVILSICYGGLKHYVDALRALNPNIDVIGASGLIQSPSHSDVVIHLISRFLRGADLESALDEAHMLRLSQVEQWSMDRALTASSGRAIANHDRA